MQKWLGISGMKRLILKSCNKFKSWLGNPKSVALTTYVDSDCELGKDTAIFENVVLINVQVGAFSYIQSRSMLCNTSIGKFCSIASDVAIGMPEHPQHFVSTSPVFYDPSQNLPKIFTKHMLLSNSPKSTLIGNDVWVGKSAIIKSGIKVGTGAIIGAGAVVTKDVEAYSIVAGNPAALIRKRFSQDVIDKLLVSAWWTLSENELMKLAPLFDDVDAFLERLGHN